MQIKPSNIDLVKVKAYFPFIVLAAVLFGEILVLAFYFPNKIFSLLEIRVKIDQLSGEVKQLENAEQSLSQVNDQDLNSTLAKATVALPDEKRVTGVITGLVNLASASGVIVKSIEFSPGRISTKVGSPSGTPVVSSREIEIGDRVLAVPANMSVNSSLVQILSYLSKLQTSGPLLGVTALNYSLSGSAPGGTISLLVYYLPNREGKPGWEFIPTISPDEIATLGKLPSSDIFRLPSVPH